MPEPNEKLPTATHTAVRVVVRGMPLPEGAQFTISELRILIVARAKAIDWPDVPLEKGDLDGVVWVKPEDAFGAAARLQADDHVVTVRLDLSA